MLKKEKKISSQEKEILLGDKGISLEERNAHRMEEREISLEESKSYWKTKEFLLEDKVISLEEGTTNFHCMGKKGNLLEEKEIQQEEKEISLKEKEISHRRNS